MRVWGVRLFVAVFLAGCGDPAVGASRNAQACSEICSLPDQCFEELDIPIPSGDCFEACDASIDEFGVDCVEAITATINCLPSCDVDTLSDEELLACQDEALAIGPACDG